MANRRSGGGGMGGFQRGGNRPFSQTPQFQGGVSPWQGTSANPNQGLFSHLSSNPQQLALALTSLLQTQQGGGNPPSLLSLHTSPAFSNQDSHNRYGGRSRDFRRHEPYNKNRGGGGWKDNRNRNQNQNRGGRDTKKDDKKPAKKDEKNDTTVDGEDEAGGEKNKRDWKDEKNAEHEKKETKSGDEKADDDKYYPAIPKSLLRCFVCDKNMWDGLSFHKHVNGRAHKQMLQSLDESFHIIVNILRESMRLCEEKKLIEMNRVERLNKKARRREPESTCNMCDLKFLGKIIAHRKTEGHQRLKRFLHPNCDICTKEFSSRMDWVEHRLTEDHLKTLTEHLEKKGDPEDGNEIVEKQDLEFDLEPLLEDSMVCEDENPILELSDDLKDLQNRIPAYKKNRAVGSECLTPYSGFVCEICKKSFTTEELGQLHLKSQNHHNNFVEAIQKKYKEQQEAAAAEKEAKEAAVKEEKTEENGEEMYDPEEACNEEEESADITKEEEESMLQDEEEQPAAEEMEAEAEEEEAGEVAEEAPVAAAAPAPVAAAAAAPTTPQRATRRPAAVSTPAPLVSNVRNGAGPKSKRGRK